MSKSLQEQQAEAGAALRELWKPLEELLLPVVAWLARFLERHPIPGWLDKAMTPLDWIGRQFGRFMRWLWRG